MISSTEPNPVSSSEPDDEDNRESEYTETQSSAAEPAAQTQGGPTIVDELGVQDLSRTYVRMHGREFAAAGRKIPVAEIDYSGMVMYHPEKPLIDGTEEVISVQHDEHGIVLNELGERRKIAGTKFRGKEVYWHKETAPNTTRHYVAWYDDEWNPHFIFLVGNKLTVDIVLKMRGRTVNGELSVFPEVSSD